MHITKENTSNPGGEHYSSMCQYLNKK
uniref:Uncharacterized protein n=1 Tax=Rhizophora mucronata TaxID=61149 RepID=A0A2P2QQM6_RHIMU